MTPASVRYRSLLRPPTPADVEGIVDTFLACWHESYAAVLPAGLLSAMTAERAHDLWSSSLAEAAPGDVVVAEIPARGTLGTRIVGVTRFGGAPDGDDPHGDGMVHSLYVAPDAQGMGIGSRLLSVAAETLTERGFTAARLWVFSDNIPSVAFYRSHGWAPDGPTRIEAEFCEPELRLTRALCSAPSVATPGMEPTP